MKTAYKFLFGAMLLAILVAFSGTAEAQSPFDKVFLPELGDSVMAIDTLDWQPMDTSWLDVAVNDTAYSYVDSSGYLFQRHDYMWLGDKVYYRSEHRWWWHTGVAEPYIKEWRIAYWEASWGE